MRNPRFLRGKRGVYIATGALLMTFVVTTGSLLTYLMVAPEIEKAKDRNHLDIVRNILRTVDTSIRELLSKEPNATTIFTMNLPKGTIRTQPNTDAMAYSVKTKAFYDPGSTSKLTASKNDDNVLTIRSQLEVDFVTGNTIIEAGSYVIKLIFENEVRLRVDDWDLKRNSSFPGTVSSSTSNYYTSTLNESSQNVDVNRDGDSNDYWLLYLSDPNEDYVFDTVAIHEPDGTLIEKLEEGDSFRLGNIPLIVYRVSERYVVFRYARIRMEVQ